MIMVSTAVRQHLAEEKTTMPDGSRARRHSSNVGRRAWYARYRSIRFMRRFGLAAPRTPWCRLETGKQN